MTEIQTQTESQDLSEAEIKQSAIAIIHDLLTVKGLYFRQEITSNVGEMVNILLRRELSIGYDSYCVGCKKESVFRLSPKPMSAGTTGGRFQGVAVPPDIFAIKTVCQRNWHVYSYVFQGSDGFLEKIGQIPSMASIAFGELKGFGSSLGKQDREELGKALGLSSHDSALGAFVYLRRVFERMIARAYERQSKNGKPVDGFETLSMDKKVSALGNELPATVVKNSSVFSILSLGLHELTEDDCQRIFPVVKAVLFQMLEHEEHQRLAAITETETDRALQRVLSDAKSV